MMTIDATDDDASAKARADRFDGLRSGPRQAVVDAPINSDQSLPTAEHLRTEPFRCGRQSRVSGPIRWLLLVLLVHATIAANAARTVARHPGDFDRFWDITQSPGLPYRDYAVEYPPGTVALFKIAAVMAPRRESFRAALIVTDLVADAAIIGMLVWGWGTTAALYYGLAVIPIITLLFFRVGLWSVALTTTAVAAWQRDRLGTAGVAAAAGAALKLWPVPFAVLLLGRLQRRNVHASAVFGILSAAMVAAWWMVAGHAGIVQVLTFRSAHGWHIETVVGSLLRLWDPSAVRLESGAMRIGSIDEATSLAMLAMGTGLAVVALWTGGRRNAIGAGWLAGVVGLLLLSPLLSPQFLGWLLPGAGIAWAQGYRRSASLVVGAVLMTILYRINTWAPGVVARNVVLVAVERSALVDLCRRPNGDADAHLSVPSAQQVAKIAQLGAWAQGATNENVED